LIDLAKALREAQKHGEELGLTEMVRRMPKLDWTQRESVRAGLRRNVRRLLARYGYPPDLAEDATQLVLRQAELSTEHSAA
jgi:type I restriction enzyme R subunit